MDEYLSEAEQWERVKLWLRQNLPWVAGGIALAVLGLAGLRWNEARKEREYVAAAKSYAELVDAFTKSDVAGATRLTDQLQTEHPNTGYAEIASLATARIQLESQQQADGSWVNGKNPRWMEGLPLLCTCYAMVALERCR